MNRTLLLMVILLLVQMTGCVNLILHRRKRSRSMTQYTLGI